MLGIWRHFNSLIMPQCVAHRSPNCLRQIFGYLHHRSTLSVKCIVHQANKFHTVIQHRIASLATKLSQMQVWFTCWPASCSLTSLIAAGACRELKYTKNPICRSVIPVGTQLILHQISMQLRSRIFKEVYWTILNSITVLLLSYSLPNYISHNLNYPCSRVSYFQDFHHSQRYYRDHHKKPLYFQLTHGHFGQSQISFSSNM